MRSKPSAAAVLAVLLVVAGLLLRKFPGPVTSRSFASEIGQEYITPYQEPIPATESRPETGGLVRGTIVDEADMPVRGIEVELIPANKTGDERWYATKREWTDAVGQYQFSHADPGDYFVAVLKHGAPDARHPFVGVYYPAAEDELTADRVLVTEPSSTELLPMHLRRLETVTLKISVTFEDGTRPNWTNLLFHNLSYPDQAVIGDEAPGIQDGHGEFTLPNGFEYYARAKVDCDAGQKIETRESRPVQRIKVADGLTVEDLTFIIPGSACKLWSPK
jgi:hypothetical protein